MTLAASGIASAALIVNMFGSNPVLLGDQSVEATQDGGKGASEAFGYTATVTGRATTIAVYLDTTDGVQLGLYTDKYSKPGVRLDKGSVTTNVAGWVSVSLAADAQIVRGTRYWIAVAALNDRSTVGYRDTGSSGSGLDYSGQGLANPYNVSQEWNSNPASVYVGGTISTPPPPVAPASTALPAITGVAEQGDALSANTGTWTGTAPITYTYQWQQDGTTAIANAKSSSYTASARDVGHTLDVVVTATNAAGSTSATSAATPVVVGLTVTPPSNTVLEVVSGTDTQGQALATTNGSWTGSPTGYAYQWRDCNSSGNNCTSIAGATSSSYMLTSGDIGHMMRVVVSATNAGGSTPATSAATAVVSGPTGPPPSPPSNTGLPVLSGTPTQGQTVSSSNGSWTGSPTSYAYSWQDCDSSGNNCTAISGASSSSYTLAAGDVGHTIRAVVTATNAAGSTAATSAQTTTVGASGGGTGLPPGVTLKPIDGGPNYYCSHGFTNACNDGWDNPSFFPIGPWYGSVSSQSDVTTWRDLGINTAFRTTGNTSLPLMNANGLSAIVDDEGSPETAGMGSETVGLLASDEPSTMSAFTNSLSSTPSAQQNGRFWYLNDTWNFINYGGLSPIGSSAQVLDTLVTTPDGTRRHDDTQSVDMYWFAGARAGSSDNLTYEGGLIYGLSGDMTNAEAECGCRYGDMADKIRADQSTYPAPIAQIIENGGPYSQNTSASSYITPPEMNWAVWSSIIHGTRQIIYFNNTFGGPGDSGNDIEDSYYETPQNGQLVSIDAQTTATDSLIKQLAPEINSPQMIGYVTTSPTSSTFSGIETRATDDNGTFTIFADTRDAETASNIPATFTTADGYTGPVTVVGENRTVQATNGVFTDTFANGSTVHVYQVP